MRIREMMKLGNAVGKGELGCIEAACCDALKRDPRDFIALMVLADTYWREEMNDDALRLATQASEIEPKHAHALRIVADVYAKRGEHDLAYPYAKLFLTADPPIQPPAVLISGFLKPFTWIPRLRRLRANVGREDTSYLDWRTWAISYVSWYESRPRSAL